ncbi:MAG: hypothetical protein Kow002_06520 [Anaerolineales bacterium]
MFNKPYKDSGIFPCDAKETIRFYKELGFFSDMSADEIIAEHKRIEGFEPVIHEPWDEVNLLTFSKNGIWMDDPETLWGPKFTTYTKLLIEWAGISHGAFKPEEIREIWGEPYHQGPIKLEFKLDGKKVSVSPNFYNDYMDLDVLKQVNELIAASGRQFELAADANFAIVFCLTAEQKVKMEERYFPFDW